MSNDFKKRKAEMTAWLKELLEWEKRNPDKDWLTELCKVQTESDDGGDRPPTPPKNP